MFIVQFNRMISLILLNLPKNTIGADYELYQYFSQVNKESKMNIIINVIKSIFKVSTVKDSGFKKSELNCNYTNNYYGDQYCQNSSKLR